MLTSMGLIEVRRRVSEITGVETSAKPGSEFVLSGNAGRTAFGETVQSQNTPTRYGYAGRGAEPGTESSQWISHVDNQGPE